MFLLSFCIKLHEAPKNMNSNNPYRHDREEIAELLLQFNNIRSGKGNGYIEEEGFERIFDYYMDKEKHADALEAIEIAINQFPYSASLLIKKADVYIALKRFSDSLTVLEQAYWLDTKELSYYVIKTDALLALGQSEDASNLLQSALVVFEGEEKIELLFQLSEVYDDYECFDQVFECLALILKEDFANEEALYKICFWTDFTGRNEEGIRLHQEIIEQNPFSELAWFNLGSAYQGIKLYEKAIDAYQYAVAIDEEFDYAYRNMGDAFIKLRKYKDAIDVLEKVVALSRPESIIFEAIGHCYNKLNNFSQARVNYKKAYHLNPEDTQLQYKIACTYMGESNWELAIKFLQAATKIHAMQPDYNVALGRCYSQLGNYEEAIIYFGNAVRVKNKNSNVWIELLNCLYDASLYNEGFEYAALAFEQTSSKPIFIYYKSAFLFASGQSKQAIQYLEQALVASPKYIKQFIEIDPSILQHQQVAELLSLHKKKKSSNK